MKLTYLYATSYTLYSKIYLVVTRNDKKRSIVNHIPFVIQNVALRSEESILLDTVSPPLAQA